MMLRYGPPLINAELMNSALCLMLLYNIKIQSKDLKSLPYSIRKEPGNTAIVDKLNSLGHRALTAQIITLNQL